MRIKETLAAADNKVKCPSCGTYNAKGAVFCNKCGTKLANASDTYEDYTQEELLDFAEEIMDEDIDL